MVPARLEGRHAPDKFSCVPIRPCVPLGLCACTETACTTPAAKVCPARRSLDPTHVGCTSWGSPIRQAVCARRPDPRRWSELPAEQGAAERVSAPGARPKPSPDPKSEPKPEPGPDEWLRVGACHGWRGPCSIHGARCSCTWAGGGEGCDAEKRGSIWVHGVEAMAVCGPKAARCGCVACSGQCVWTAGGAGASRGVLDGHGEPDAAAPECAWHCAGGRRRCGRRYGRSRRDSKHGAARSAAAGRRPRARRAAD